jgi:hypothetical protein
MERPDHQPFDFDAWAALAQNDPAEFELRRQQAIEALIQSASPTHQRRLRGLQFRIDMERARCRSPMAACIRLYQMTIDSFYNDLLPQLNGQTVTNKKTDVPASLPKATVLSFPVPTAGSGNIPKRH